MWFYYLLGGFALAVVLVLSLLVMRHSELTDQAICDLGSNDNKMNELDETLKNNINALVDTCHGAAAAAGWWEGEKTVETVPAKLCLIHSEISEAMEGDRKDLMDDKLPHRKMLEVELADAVIRIADLCGEYDMDLGGAIVEKIAFNAQRADHKLENRAKEGGKSY